jgi:hypothetical protein
MRQATVQAVAADGTASLSIGGGPTQAGYVALASYAPVVGDTVWALRDGPDWLVLGPVGAGWVAPTLLNAWVNYDVTTFNAAGYRRVGGMVVLRGLVKSGTINTPIFNLPAAFRPARENILATVSNDLFGEARVTSVGDVRCTVGSNTWVSLDNLGFSLG